MGIGFDRRRVAGVLVSALGGVALLSVGAITWNYAAEGSGPVSGTVVRVDISRLPSQDCEYVVGHRDLDGLPGGPTRPRMRVDCP